MGRRGGTGKEEGIGPGTEILKRTREGVGEGDEDRIADEDGGGVGAQPHGWKRGRDGEWRGIGRQTTWKPTSLVEEPLPVPPENFRQPSDGTPQRNPLKNAPPARRVDGLTSGSLVVWL